MFRSSADRLHAWLTGAGDMLLGDPELADEPAFFDQELEIFDGEPASFDRSSYAGHPHRRALRWERRRRPGTVPARPAHCISPVRHQPSESKIRFP
jgi:hypothetical protein